MSTNLQRFGDLLVDPGQVIAISIVHCESKLRGVTAEAEVHLLDVGRLEANADDARQLLAHLKNADRGDALPEAATLHAELNASHESRRNLVDRVARYLLDKNCPHFAGQILVMKDPIYDLLLSHFRNIS